MKLFVILCFIVWSMKPVDAKDYRILVLPSGGATGIIPATLLARLEAETGQPVYKLFDEIWGSSIGAMTAALLTTPRGNPDVDRSKNNSLTQSARPLPLDKPRSAAEIVEFIEDTFAKYHRAAAIRKRFRQLIHPETSLKETLIPIRILSGEIKKWWGRGCIIPKKIELRSFCTDQDGDLSLLSIACGSCTLPPVHRAEPLDLGNNNYSYFIDAGHELVELCGSLPCMNPMFNFMKDFSSTIDLQVDTVSLFFLSNGWVNLHPNWGTEGQVRMQDKNDEWTVPVHLFNVAVDLAPAIQEWHQKTRTGRAWSPFKNYPKIINNLAGIGAVHTPIMKKIAEDVAKNSPVFHAMVTFLKQDLNLTIPDIENR